MLGEEEVVVLDVKPVDLHGVIYRDVTVTFPDRSIGQARLGPEGVPTDLEPGEAAGRSGSSGRRDRRLRQPRARLPRHGGRPGEPP